MGISAEDVVYDCYIYWLNQEMSIVQRAMVKEYQTLLYFLNSEKYYKFKP